MKKKVFCQDGEKNSLWAAAGKKPIYSISIFHEVSRRTKNLIVQILFLESTVVD
jgi:hypothetical protein